MVRLFVQFLAVSWAEFVEILTRSLQPLRVCACQILSKSADNYARDNAQQNVILFLGSPCTYGVLSIVEDLITYATQDSMRGGGVNQMKLKRSYWEGQNDCSKVYMMRKTAERSLGNNDAEYAVAGYFFKRCARFLRCWEVYMLFCTDHRYPIDDILKLVRIKTCRQNNSWSSCCRGSELFFGVFTIFCDPSGRITC